MVKKRIYADAAHLALAALHGMDYLATWNQTHLDNPELRGRIAAIIKSHGLSATLILTRNVCWRWIMVNDELDPVEETRVIREKIMRKYKTTDAYFEHLKTIPTAEVLLAQVRRRNENAKSADKPAGRRRTAKRPSVHA